MEQNPLQFDDFLREVHPADLGFVNGTHDLLMQNDCVLKIQPSKKGYVVSYVHKKSKRTLINFVFRKQGLVVRLYGDRVCQRTDLLDELPDALIDSIEKSPVCRRLLDPAACNSRCSMGYDFTLRGENHKKCRYSCFMLDVNEETTPFIASLIGHELDARNEA